MKYADKREISIIIPVYNKKESLVETVKCVLTQTYKLFELIIIDDGSTDGGIKLIENINDKRMRIIRQTNRGVSAARNAGIKFSRFDLIAFIDADDNWAPNFLEEMMKEAMEHPECVCIICNIILKSALIEHSAISKRINSQVIDRYAAWFIATKGWGYHPSNAVIRKQALLETGGFLNSIKCGEDVDMGFRLSCLGPFYYLNKNLTIYNCDIPGSIQKTMGAVYPACCNTIDLKIKNYELRGNRKKDALRLRKFLMESYAANLGLSGRRLKGMYWLIINPPYLNTIRMWLRAWYSVLFGK